MAEPRDTTAGEHRSQFYRNLERSEPLRTTLAREQAAYDCTSCRVMGATAFAGLGAYTYYSGHQQLRLREKEILESGSRLTMRARGLGITGMSAVLVGLGLYRWFV